MTTHTEDTHKELPPIKDKIQQIFKFLETADVSQWQGMNVFEAGDADSLYGILETAFLQAQQEERKRVVEVLEGKKVKWYDNYHEDSSVTYNKAIDEAIRAINTLNK